MPATIVIGAQWGDEGKGKIIDVLSDLSDCVVRFNGGNNAGHTVKNQFGTFPLHLIPSGIFSKKAIAFISNGVVLDLDVLADEIDILEKAGFKLRGRMFISPRCHVILPYHKLLDNLYESAKGKAKTGTTGRGIGPVYADKVSYNGIRLFDLLNPQQFSSLLKTQLTIKNKIIKSFGETPLDHRQIVEKYGKLISKLKPYIQEPYPLLLNAVKNNKSILFEGAQGVFLDNDWGTYPYVTGSTVISGGVSAATGINQKFITHITGVVKAYTTRVGGGPFPTELKNKTGEFLLKAGGEYGTTTGRPRRCGWFDAELVKFAVQINGLTEIALTKIDVLDDLPELKICTGYEYKGKKANYYDGDAVFLDQIKPVYKTLTGWQQSTKGITKYSALPANAKKYVSEIEKLINCQTKYISTGPGREETIVR